MVPAIISLLRKANPMLLCAVIAAFYLTLIAMLPANQLSMQQYGWSSRDYHFIYMLIVVPLVAMWFAAFYGYYTLRRYADLLGDTADGRDYKKLSTGVAWLAWGLPLPSIVAALLNNIASSNPDFRDSAVVLANYISVIIPIIAFSIISSAAHNLVQRNRLRVSLSGARAVILTFITLGVVFCYFIFRQIDLNNLSSNTNPYYLSSIIIITTLIIPYLYAWFTGLLAAYEINILAANSQGLLYSRALRLFAFGLIAVIGSSILLQYIGSATPRTGHLELNTRLFATYIFRVLTAAGFLLMAVGAHKLQKIEEV